MPEPVGPGGPLAPHIFGRSVNPIPTGEDRLYPPITTAPPPLVFHLSASLSLRNHMASQHSHPHKSDQNYFTELLLSYLWNVQDNTQSPSQSAPTILGYQVDLIFFRVWSLKKPASSFCVKIFSHTV